MKLIIPIITTYSSKPNSVNVKNISYTYYCDHEPMVIHLMYQSLYLNHKQRNDDMVIPHCSPARSSPFGTNWPLLQISVF